MTKDFLLLSLLLHSNKLVPRLRICLSRKMTECILPMRGFVFAEGSTYNEATAVISLTIATARADIKTMSHSCHQNERQERVAPLVKDRSIDVKNVGKRT